MTKGRLGGHSAPPPPKPAPDPGRNMHPNARVTTQAAVKRDPCVKGKGK